MQLTTGRLADPQEIADALVLLASPRSGSTTGAQFVIDSGWDQGDLTAPSSEPLPQGCDVR
jgi:NAD(P)-dependent dehydrogenase (short-subunit alcohol dehydrogenase family)